MQPMVVSFNSVRSIQVTLSRDAISSAFIQRGVAWTFENIVLISSDESFTPKRRPHSSSANARSPNGSRRVDRGGEILRAP